MKAAPGTLALGMKRLLDLKLAVVGLLLGAPVFLLVGLALRLNGQDVLFVQDRLGRRGQPFRILKFTTMAKGSEQRGLLTASDDVRPTRLGRFLRRTKLNELPQLLNILGGTMSFVGPRPLVEKHVSQYTDPVRKVISAWRPGLTGYGTLFFRNEPELLAQVANRDHFYDSVVLPMKGRLEQLYAEGWTPWRDLNVLIHTLASMAIGADLLPKRIRAYREPFLQRCDAYRRDEAAGRLSP